MGKEICTVCGREIDSRGMSGHMRTHKGKIKLDGDDGVISYPRNEDPYQDDEPQNSDIEYTSIKKQVKTPVKKQVTSKPASNPTSKPDTRGQRKTETGHITELESAGHPKDSDAHKQEWLGLFRD